MSDSQKFRDRKFVAVLYPEDPTHAAAIEKMKSGGYNFAGILHDKDVYEDGEHEGEIKKAHWHIVVRFKNAVWNTAISNELGIEANYLEACKDVDSALLYLVHFGNEEKYQYEYETVFGPLKVRLATLLAEPDEGSRVLSLVDIVESAPGPLGYTELIKKAVSAGVYADLRRMGALGVKMLEEHNYEVWREVQDAQRHNKGVSESFNRFREFETFTGHVDPDKLPPL